MSAAIKPILLTCRSFRLSSPPQYAVFAAVGRERIDSNFATLIRSLVILIVLGGIILALGNTPPLSSTSGWTWTFLILSGLTTGASWLCFFGR